MRLFRRGEAASTLDLLVAGLGNPGREYEQTRHNVGWLVADQLARRHGGSFRSKFSGRVAEVRLGDLRLALLKPETYMNLVGGSVSAAARFFKVDPERLLIVHDDIDLEPRRLPARELVGDHPADVVPRLLVLAPGVPETRDQQVERRDRLASTASAASAIRVAALSAASKSEST